MPTSWSESAARRAGFRRRHAAKLQRQRHVLLGRERRQQVERLENEAHPLAADDRALVVVERGQIDPFEQHLAAGGSFNAPQNVQQRALARTRRAHDRQQLALADLEVDAAQGMYADLALGPIGFLQAAGFKHIHGQFLGGSGLASFSSQSDRRLPSRFCRIRRLRLLYEISRTRRIDGPRLQPWVAGRLRLRPDIHHTILPFPGKQPSRQGGWIHAQ